MTTAQPTPEDPATGGLQRLGGDSRVVGIDKDARTASLADGSQLQYESLLTTMPLDLTLRWLGKPDWADELTHRWGDKTYRFLATMLAIECHLLAADWTQC